MDAAKNVLFSYRFPIVGESLIKYLSAQDLDSCSQVLPDWQRFISNEKSYWIKKLKNYVAITIPKHCMDDINQHLSLNAYGTGKPGFSLHPFLNASYISKTELIHLMCVLEKIEGDKLKRAKGAMDAILRAFKADHLKYKRLLDKKFDAQMRMLEQYFDLVGQRMDSTSTFGDDRIWRQYLHDLRVSVMSQSLRYAQ